MRVKKSAEEESSCWSETFSNVEEFEENMTKKVKKILIKHLEIRRTTHRRS